ncbi:polyprenol monophosphomannose synthase [Nocardioides marmorisolisilvae]|uniref:Polyprenol monophosphomannose synthase n=1 Tax=Nocardioides marmorisolisilvae TaxID=1542737 RepID=A0A3N0DTK9_9ACTN|nr:polyprenol monophosphomannose synthase [Nocardioides marmorisolisilvae]RNL78959.1 polyprenol monophosphomannose synthase [Nocardioides marmorisolisilvae]
MTMTPHVRRLVVMPTYQEAETITTALDAVLRAAPGVDILVVDDSSPDGTADLVRSHPAYGSSVHLLVRPEKNGLGAAYRAGFAWALNEDYHQIAQMDADLSHPPGRLPALFEALGEADVAVGSRYVPGGAVDNWGLHRRLLSRGGNVYVRAVLGTGVRDNTAGFKAFRRDALLVIEVLASESSGYAFQIENTWRAHRRGLRIVEVPITFTDRTAGTSKMSGPIAREALRRALQWRLAELRERPAAVPSVGRDRDLLNTR